MLYTSTINIHPDPTAFPLYNYVFFFLFTFKFIIPSFSPHYCYRRYYNVIVRSQGSGLRRRATALLCSYRKILFTALFLCTQLSAFTVVYYGVSYEK